eukprot:8225130-Alexandrium_andersonii.AAC.1
MAWERAPPIVATSGGGTALPIAWKVTFTSSGSGWSAGNLRSAASSLRANHLTPLLTTPLLV